MKLLLGLMLMLCGVVGTTQTPTTLLATEKYSEMSVAELHKLETELTKKLKRNNNDDKLLGKLANLYVYLGRLEEAFPLFDKLIGLYPKAGIYYYEKAMAKASIKLYAEALELMDKAIDVDRDFGPFYLERGILKGEMGDLDGELEDYNRSIELDPSNFAAYSNRGKCYYMSGNFAMALEDLNKSMALDASEAGQYSNRGMVYYEMGNFAAAMADFDKSLSIDPKNGSAWMWRGITNHALGNLEKALNDLDNALKYGAEKGFTHNAIAQVKITQGDYKAALLSINAAIAAENSALYYTERGIIYSQLKKFPEAFADFGKALQLEPRNARTWICLASARFLADDYLGCIEAANKALEISDTLTNALIIRARAKDNLGQYLSAIDDYTVCLAKQPTNANLYEARGSCYYSLSPPNYKLAAADYEKATQLDPEFAGAWHNLGLSYYNGDIDEAKACECFAKAKKLGLSMSIKAYKDLCE